MSIDALLAGPVRIVNIGLEGFARDLVANGATVVHVEWKPPRWEFAALLGQSTEAANREAVRRILEAEPALTDVRRAGDLIPELDAGRLVLHAGPPIAWERMCGPLRGAICGAAVFEGWASDLAAAEKLAASGAIEFAPNHHFGAVGPMTGITTRSMPLLVVENRVFGNWGACTINEGLGKVMRFGGNDPEVLSRLRWLRDEFGLLLGRALRAAPLELNTLVARGLAMGDEMHQRNVACSSLAFRALAPRLASMGGDLEKAFAFMAGNDQFFLNVAMAMGKSILDPAGGIRGSTIVTAMARNGTDFGIRVSAFGERWFTAPVEMPVGLYFPGYSAADANPDLGDSAIVETIGLGGGAMAASPAVARFLGAGGVAEALATTAAIREICHAEHPHFRIATLDERGAPAGIDVLRVVETGIAPLVNTGIASKVAGVGQVGAGVVRAPLGCFVAALEALAETARAS